MLEAGRSYDPVNETPMLHTPSQAPLMGDGDAGQAVRVLRRDGRRRVAGARRAVHQHAQEPHEEFRWWRPRMMGGRTNHWGRISLRNGPYDFKPQSRDGLGFDWPITYEDVEPYYTKVEMLIGVYGTNEGLENTPDSPPTACCCPRPRAGRRSCSRRSTARSSASRSSRSTARC